MGDGMYYLVGICDRFVHVKDGLSDIILSLIDQKNDEQLSYMIEMKFDDTMAAFYEYASEWESVKVFRNSFCYKRNDDDVVEATLTNYGMMISDVPNNPMFRWFHYCYEHVLIMEIL